MLNRRKILDLMYENKLNQKDLAEKIDIPYSTLSMNINGQVETKVSTLIKLAQFFNVTTDWLLDLSEDRNPTKTNGIVQTVMKDSFFIALYGETKDLSEDQKKDILDLVNHAIKLIK